jgi:hypothetical protein
MFATFACHEPVGPGLHVVDWSALLRPPPTPIPKLKVKSEPETIAAESNGPGIAALGSVRQ